VETRFAKILKVYAIVQKIVKEKINLIFSALKNFAKVKIGIKPFPKHVKKLSEVSQYVNYALYLYPQQNQHQEKYQPKGMFMTINSAMVLSIQVVGNSISM